MATIPFQFDQAYLIRTVTFTSVGRVIEIYENFIVLEDAAWIADTGRFHNALRDGELNEVEPYPNGCIVGLGAIVDAQPWIHALPLQQK